MTYQPKLPTARARVGPIAVAVLGEEAGARPALLQAVALHGLQVVDLSAAEVVLWDPGVEREAVAARLKRLEHMEVPVVVVLRDKHLASHALALGARGLLMWQQLGDGVEAALSAAAHGLVVVDPSFAPMGTWQAERGDGEVQVGALTERERQVVQLLADGLSNKSIAEKLGISDHTAKFHVTGVMHKLGAASRTEAVVAAVRRGWVAL